MARRTGILLEEELTHSVIGAFFDVYNTLGYGFLEHVYAMALERELLARGHRVGREVSVNIAYKGITLTSQRLDLVIDNWDLHGSEIDYAPLSGGKHELKVQYFQIDGWAELRVDILRGMQRSPGSPGPH